MKKIQMLNRIVIGLVMTIILLLSNSNIVNAAYTTSVSLGDAYSFAILSGSTITNTGTTNITGTAGSNIAVYSGSAITEDAGPIVTSGTKYSGGEQIALDAKIALTAAYGDIQGRTTTSVIGEELGNTTLVSGVYSSQAGYFGLTGTLTLDAQNDPNAIFIFKMGSTLTTAGASNMILKNGADPCRIFWQVGSSATLGTNSTIFGHILTETSITATTGAVVNGSLLAQNGAVTLEGNTIVNNGCAATTATLTVIKNVINDNNGNGVASDFSISVKLNNVDVAGSPAYGSAIGVTYTLEPGIYTIDEPAHSGYDLDISGDIESNATVTLVAGDNKTITLNNNDVPPAGTPTTTPAPIPTTSSDLGTLILFGGLLAIIGAIGWYVKRKV